MSKTKKELIKFGNFLKELRKKRGFTASSVAISAKLTKYQLSAYENGKICMSADKFIRISDAMFLTSEERRELYELYEQARAEAYKNFSKAAKLREKSKKNT